MRSMTDMVPLCMGCCDGQARYTFVNRSYAARLGLQPEDFLGRTMDEMMGTKWDALLHRHVETALAGQRVDCEVAVPCGPAADRTVTRPIAGLPSARRPEYPLVPGIKATGVHFSLAGMGAAAD